MGIEKCNAVVLRFADYKEADRMLTLFSREEGKLSAAIKGVKKQKSKLRSGAELFALGEYVFNDKAGRLTVTGYTSLDTFYPIREDLERLWCATLAVNAVETVATVQPEPELFDSLVFSLSQLAYNDSVTSVAIINCFFMRLLDNSGIYPVMQACSCNGEKLYYNRAKSGFACKDCATNGYIALESKSIDVLNHTDWDNNRLLLELNSLEASQQKKIFKILTDHASFCLDKRFKAVTFLESIML